MSNSFRQWLFPQRSATEPTATSAEPSFDPHTATAEELDQRIQELAKPQRPQPRPARIVRQDLPASPRPSATSSSSGMKPSTAVVPSTVKNITDADADNIGEHQAPSDRDQKRQEMQDEINERVRQYQQSSRRWYVLYYWLALSALVANVVVLVLSTRGTALLDAATLGWCLIALSAYSALAIPLNTQFQCHMNAVYFEEAARKYAKLKFTIWQDMELVEAALQRYAEKYTPQGVGGAVDLVALAAGMKRGWNRGVKKALRKVRGGVKAENDVEKGKTEEVGVDNADDSKTTAAQERLRELKRKRYAYPKK